jgi:hypothetical protein
MSVLVQYKNDVHLFKFGDVRSIRLSDLQASAEARFCTGLNDLVEHPCRLLCDGPEAPKPLDEEGFSRIIESASNSATCRTVRQVDEMPENTIRLWLREFGEQVFIFI